MLNIIRDHETYLEFVVDQLNTYYKCKTFLKDFYSNQIIWCSLMDLTETDHLMKDRYSSNP
ncbi:DDE transposase, partial [Bacillus cereus]